MCVYVCVRVRERKRNRERERESVSDRVCEYECERDRDVSVREIEKRGMDVKKTLPSFLDPFEQLFLSLHFRLSSVSREKPKSEERNIFVSLQKADQKNNKQKKEM